MRSIFKKTKAKDNSICYIFLNEHDKKIKVEDYLQGFYDSYLIEAINAGLDRIVFQKLEDAIQVATHYPDNGPQTRYFLALNCSEEDLKKGNPFTGTVKGRPLHQLIEQALPATSLEDQIKNSEKPMK